MSSLLFSGLAMQQTMPLAVLDYDTSHFQYDPGEIFTGTLSHHIKITNPTAGTYAHGRLSVPLIKNETARCFVLEVNFSETQGFAVIDDSYGNVYAKWDDVVIGPGQAFLIQIDYRLVSFGVHYIVNSSITWDYDKNSSFFKEYTRPETLIQSDNPEIASEALNLTNGLINAAEKVAKLYNFVTTYLSYEAQDEERGALWALRSKTGDCSEYSYLFVALCRAAGIPSRVCAGFAFHQTPETTEDGHMWAEYYLVNCGWIPVDPTWHFFNSLDSRHFCAIQSIPKPMPYANYVFESTEDVSLKDEQTVLIRPFSADALSMDIFLKNIADLSQATKNAEETVGIAGALGARWVFRDEIEAAELLLSESEFFLRNAVETWNASLIASAVDRTELASRGAGLALAKMLALFMTIPAAAGLVIIVSTRRRSKKEDYRRADFSSLFTWKCRRGSDR